MSAVLDTHAVLWYLLESSNLSQPAFALIDRAASVGTPVYLSAISVVEVAYLAERGRVPPNAFDKLIGTLQQENAALVTVPVDLKIAAVLKTIPRDAVPDMPDRIIAATAVHLRLPLVTRDRRLQSAGIETIW